MRIILGFLLLFSLSLGINYSVTSSQDRNGAYRSQLNEGGKLKPKVTPAQRAGVVRRNQGSQVMPYQGPTRSILPLNINVYPRRVTEQSQRPQVYVVPPTQSSQARQDSNLDVRVFPPTIEADSKNQPRINTQVGESRPITQDMMFQKQPQYRMKLPPPKRTKRVLQVQVAPPPLVQYEYEGEDIEPLFIRNRNGVLVGVGIGGSFDRLWVTGSKGNARFYDSAFAYYFRLGYQYYFTDYLGLRAYANLGDWSNKFSGSFFDGERNVSIEGEVNFRFNFFAELLYDFVVLSNHSVGMFAGFGIGASYGEFSNDSVEPLSEYFAMPAISVGLAYTLYENNRFELEAKVPLRSEVLEQDKWRAKLSTWLIGVSYTYIF